MVPLSLQVTPVSTVTVLQQDPFMLFYELQQGSPRHAVQVETFKHQKTINAESCITHDVLSLCQVRPLFTDAYLTDEVGTST